MKTFGRLARLNTTLATEHSCSYDEGGDVRERKKGGAVPHHLIGGTRDSITRYRNVENAYARVQWLWAGTKSERVVLNTPTQWSLSPLARTSPSKPSLPSSLALLHTAIPLTTMSIVAPSPPPSSSSYPRPPTRSLTEPSPVTSATDESVRPLRCPRRHLRI